MRRRLPSVLLQGDAGTCAEWQRTLESRYRPDVQVLNLADARDLPAALVKGPAPAAGANAWICRRMTCLPPLQSVAAVEAALASTP